MNKALVAKLGWRVINDHTSLWARVVRSKYKVGGMQEYSWLVNKSNWSSTWRSIMLGLREVVSKGFRWVVGDGSLIRFWTGKWMDEAPLADDVVTDLEDGFETILVRDLWINGFGWDMSKISPYLSLNRRLDLFAFVVDKEGGVRGRLAWSGTTDGAFSVASAYNILTRDMTPKPNMESLFSRVWKVVAPKRIKIFLWLTLHQVIMTNMERLRRHLSVDGTCQVCKGGMETILHVLRDCAAMAGIWNRLVPARQRYVFFEKSLFEWFYENLGCGKETKNGNWSTVFSVAVWWDWKWRCGNVFGEIMRCRDRLRFVKDKAKEVHMVYIKHAAEVNNVGRIERLIKWVKPELRWWKLNTYGASQGNPGLATAGGVIRDENGGWIGGFALNIGHCSAPLAELWGVYYGLWIAWEKHIPKLELEVDYEIVVGFLRTGIAETHPLSFQVRLCHGFLSKDWIVRVNHVYREANRLADGLANYAFTFSLGLHSFELVHDVLNQIFCDDVTGMEFPRQIRV